MPNFGPDFGPKLVPKIFHGFLPRTRCYNSRKTKAISRKSNEPNLKK